MKNRVWFHFVFGMLIALIVTAMIVACGSLTIKDLDWKTVPRVETQEAFFFALPAIGGLLSAAASIGSGIYNAVQQKNTQETVWNREDNAVARRAIDLENAGMSKTLAAGSAATTTATSAPQYQGHGVQDAIAAAMNIQGIKNAQQENANMKKSYQVMNSQIDQNYADMSKKTAEANYFNAQTQKALIDGQVSSYLGLKYLQDVAESQERSKGYKYQRNQIDSLAELNAWKMLREAAEMDLITSTGQNSSVGGVGNGVLRLGGQLMNNLMNSFKVGHLSAARTYRFPEKVK